MGMARGFLMQGGYVIAALMARYMRYSRRSFVYANMSNKIALSDIKKICSEA